MPSQDAVAILLCAAIVCPFSFAAAPDQFSVRFSFEGAALPPVDVNVTRAYAPLGADRFYELVQVCLAPLLLSLVHSAAHPDRYPVLPKNPVFHQDKFFDDSAFFRYVPGFVVQFGIAADPAETAKWATPIQDDPVVRSNVAGTLTFATAGPNTRTTQLFINFAANSRLDAQGFAPIGEVAKPGELASFIGLTNPTPGDSDGIDQDKLTSLGNAWLLKNYPTVSRMRVEIV
jgi:peptidyl-prolyl cis-trans isomerase A (cyclophilin A)